MANSRSNIYPVQLQGAELNLNKLDAEIKQYSGFNKNNAPFVGGCLSNIFTKDETIEGATSKNTYIAPNGDVYRVNTEGLWKNDTKLIDTSEADFFDVVDLGVNAFPESTVYVYDEETYIYIKDGKYFYHSGEVDHDFLSPYNITLNSLLYKYIDFQIIKKIYNNEEYEVVGIFFRNTYSGNNNRHFFLNIYKKNEYGALNEVYIKYLDDNYFRVTGVESVLSFILKVDDNFNIALLTGYDKTSQKNNYKFTFNGNIISDPTVLTVVTLNNQSLGNSFCGFRFTDKNAVRCYYSDFITVSVSTDTDVKCTYSINFENNQIILNTNYYNSNIKNVIQSYGDKKIIIRPWGIQSVVGFEDSFLFSIDDDVTTFAYLDKSDTSGYPYNFNMGGILNNCVLINNYESSGLALPGGFVLVTDWNSVDLKFIFFGDNTDEWKNNKYIYLWKNINTGKWFKLVKSIPWLKIINNQVVINSNTQFNSIDISRNRKLLFAPAWNNRRPNIKSTETYPNRVSYMATAINEYALKDNSSLILNPVLVSGDILMLNEGAFNDVYKDVVVNLYKGLIKYNNVDVSNPVIYAFSFYLNDNKVLFRKDSLLDLPFPSNTDGNVQYSPSLFSEIRDIFGDKAFIKSDNTYYPLMKENNNIIMSFFLASGIDNLEEGFIVQGQFYGIINKGVYSINYNNGIVGDINFVVSVENLQFCGNTPYEALFFSKTNRCLYSFTGANVLNAKQFVDKISEVRNYKYNPATQSIFLITDIGVIVYSLFGIYQIEFLNCQDMYLLNNGVILTDNEGTFKYVKYYKEETTDDYTKENIQLETMFYGMNNQTVTINDCLYMRIFSEEHEEGDLEVSATTLSLEGRMTEKTTFKIKASDWDAITHTIYLRYQPKEQRGLGISFSINSPFKIASLSVGSQADAILVDKVSKGAINAPQRTSNNVEW